MVIVKFCCCKMDRKGNTRASFCLNHRKYVIWRILSPYLLNIKKLPKEESYSVIKDWLDKCDKLEKLNFNAKIKIREGLRGASKGYLPISLEKLKEENKSLYDIVVNKGDSRY